MKPNLDKIPNQNSAPRNSANPTIEIPQIPATNSKIPQIYQALNFKAINFVSNFKDQNVRTPLCRRRRGLHIGLFRY
ncbi:hypothetical protein, partial [uncultured Campylobacter sp.]|uniref:hypothetical protein n=1 Tax=uncultured Campylobacter sp. TaxID=218934 RepID=UPI0026374225